MRFFKMPNKIFTYSLSPKAVFVYTYLTSHMNTLYAAVVGYDEISCCCHMDHKTAALAVKELLHCGLISVKARRNYRGNLKNRYMIANLPGGWFKVEHQVFKTEIRCTDSLIYCFIKKCMDNKTGEAFPSLTKIASATGISRGRVSQGVQYLRRYTFINHVRRHFRHTMAYRHNRYFPFRAKKEKTHSTKRVFIKAHGCISAVGNILARIIIVRRRGNVKSSFCSRGSPQIPMLLFIPTKHQLKKK